MVGSQGFEPWRSAKGKPGLQPGAFGHLSQLPTKTRLVKDLAEGRRFERLCPEKDPGVAGQWDTSYPSLPETLSLFGSLYRLNERHKECPAERQ